MKKIRFLKFGNLTETIFWIIILTAVIFVNISPQIIFVNISSQLVRTLRVQFMLAFSLFFLILVFNRLVAFLPSSKKRNFLKIFVYSLFLTLFFYTFSLKRVGLGVLYLLPVLVSFSLSLSLITQPRALVLILVAMSLFLLGDIYWGAYISAAAELTLPVIFSKVFSLSLLSIFGYYLYRSQQSAAEQASIYSSKLRDANEELNRKTTELEKANERLKELAEIESRFVATVSHELRTPLTAIRNSLKLIEYETKGNNSVDDYLGIIKKNVDRQALMIDNLLDLARIERGYPQGGRSQVDLSKVIGEVVDLLKEEAHKKGIQLSFKSENAPAIVWADQEQIRRVFINLMDNGIKFTPAGGWVEASIVDAGDDIKAIVSDNGPGIAEEHKEKIFEAFVQLEDKDTKSTSKGIGLGLTIVKEITELHKGRVWFESELGKGTRFFVLLPKDLRK